MTTHHPVLPHVPKDVTARKKKHDEKITVPALGMGATVHGWTDSHAATIIKVWPSGKRVTVQRDTARLLNGFASGEPDALRFSPGGFCGHTSGAQRWELIPNPKGVTEDYTLRTNGQWVLVGDALRGGTRLTVGKRHHHYDFNF